MVGDGELHVAEGKLVPAADMHGMSLGSLAFEVAHDLVVGDHDGTGLFRDLSRIAEMIAVTVGNEDGVELCERFRFGRGLRVPVEERVYEHPVRPVIDLPAIMTVISKSQHDPSLLWTILNTVSQGTHWTILSARGI